MRTEGSLLARSPTILEQVLMPMNPPQVLRWGQVQLIVKYQRFRSFQNISYTDNSFIQSATLYVGTNKEGKGQIARCLRWIRVHGTTDSPPTKEKFCIATIFKDQWTERWNQFKFNMSKVKQQLTLSCEEQMRPCVKNCQRTALLLLHEVGFM
jgi:hypothetical protein